MLSNNQKKLIASMSQKKQRDKHNFFLAEGYKTVNVLLRAENSPVLLVATKSWKIPSDLQVSVSPIIVGPSELSKLSLLKTPRDVLGLFHQPKYIINNDAIKDKLALVLDGVQDPGNLGTIIRIADWFGIEQIICSIDTVDVFNPKVVQATMGAISRVKVLYVDLKTFIEKYLIATGNSVYGTYPDRDNIYHIRLESKGLIVMGNEGQGIRPEISNLVTRKITIPGGDTGSESLNVGMSTAIICSEFIRQQFYLS